MSFNLLVSVTLNVISVAAPFCLLSTIGNPFSLINARVSSFFEVNEYAATLTSRALTASFIENYLRTV